MMFRLFFLSSFLIVRFIFGCVCFRNDCLCWVMVLLRCCFRKLNFLIFFWNLLVSLLCLFLFIMVLFFFRCFFSLCVFFWILWILVLLVVKFFCRVLLKFLVLLDENSVWCRLIILMWVLVMVGNESIIRVVVIIMKILNIGFFLSLIYCC